MAYTTIECCADMYLMSTHVQEVSVQINRAMRAINSPTVTILYIRAWLLVLLNSAPIFIASHSVEIKEHISLKSPIAATSPWSVFYSVF